MCARFLAGVCESVFSADEGAEKSLSRDVYLFTSVQVSDVDRAQTASVLRMAATADPAVGRRFFDAYRA